MKNHIIVTPFINGDFIVEDDEVLQTPIINSINNEMIYADVYDHFFYIDCIENMEIYDNFEDACKLIYDMTAIFFDDYPDIDSVLITIKNYNDDILFHIVVDYLKEIDDFSISFLDLGEDDDCDGDCKHCISNNNNNETKTEDTIQWSPVEMFYFGFDW